MKLTLICCSKTSYQKFVPPCACFKKYLSEWRFEQEKKKEEFVKFIAKILENEEKMENLEKENEAFKRNEEFAKVVF